MSCQQVISEPGVSRLIPEHRLEPVRGRASFRCQPSDGYPIASHHHGLAMLDSVEEIGEVPRRLGSSHRDHECILSDLVRIYILEALRAWRPSPKALEPSQQGGMP